MFLGIVSASADLVETLRQKGVLTHEEAQNIRIEETKKSIVPENVDIDIGGEIELEYHQAESSDYMSDEDAKLKLDKAVLKPKVTFKDTGIELGMEFEFSDSDAYFEKGGVTFTQLPGDLDQELFVGLDSRFIKPKFPTETYPMLGTALWRDQEYQLAWEAEYSPVYWGVSVGEGLRVGDKAIGEDSGSSATSEKYNEIYQDNDNETNKTGHWELGAKLGVQPDIGDAGSLDVLGYGFFGELDSTDISSLQSYFTGYSSNDDTMNRYGTQVHYKYNGFDLLAEMAELKTGDLSMKGWYVGGGYKIKTGRDKWFTSFTPYIRYGEWDPDAPTKNINYPITWNRETTTLALITKVTDNVKLKSEYLIHDEKTGSGGIDNDEFLTQLEVKF
jgi:hypothetical protein